MALSLTLFVCWYSRADYETERHVLFVACTRARAGLLVSGFEPDSEFLEDLNKPYAQARFSGSANELM